MIADVAWFDIVVILFYLFLTAYLGWLGYRGTRTTADYLVAGRETHPFIMALSYGATFISTSAIVGFGGVAGLFGMSLLWLTFSNIFIGIFIAFIFLGEPTRRLGHHLDAHTFPELLGRRFQSPAIQMFAGLVILCFIPLYGAAVLIGGTEFIATAFDIPYGVALLLFAVLVAAYVIYGGLKAVMYTDAMQGVIMFVGMAVLVGYAYMKVGGITAGHQALTDLAPLVPPNLQAIGHQGWTAMPRFGFGDTKYNLWWIVITTITLGVAIGVLAQPQLVVRFMTVKSRRELNRAVGVGGLFILAMTGGAYTVGALSNAYFSQHGAILTGRVIQEYQPGKPYALLQLMRTNDSGVWLDVVDERKAGSRTVLKTTLTVPAPDPAGGWRAVASVTNADGTVLEGQKAPVRLDPVRPFREAIPGQPRIAQGRSISIVYAKGNDAQIIPLFVTSAMPKWFGLLFLLTLLAAAMSTLSSQFHTLGTAAGRDVFGRWCGALGGADRTILVVRIAILLGLILAVSIGYYGRSETIIARATAIFFGLCASTFLPAFIGGLFWQRMTKAGAIASMVTGFVITAFWLSLVKMPELQAIGLVKTSLLAGWPNWPVVDPLVVALPLSTLAAVAVSLVTRPPDRPHLALCFPAPAATTSTRRRIEPCETESRSR